MPFRNGIPFLEQFIVNFQYHFTSKKKRSIHKAHEGRDRVFPVGFWLGWRSRHSGRQVLSRTELNWFQVPVSVETEQGLSWHFTLEERGRATSSRACRGRAVRRRGQASGSALIPPPPENEPWRLCAAFFNAGASLAVFPQLLSFNLHLFARRVPWICLISRTDNSI